MLKRISGLTFIAGILVLGTVFLFPRSSLAVAPYGSLAAKICFSEKAKDIAFCPKLYIEALPDRWDLHETQAYNFVVKVWNLNDAKYSNLSDPNYRAVYEADANNFAAGVKIKIIDSLANTTTNAVTDAAGQFNVPAATIPAGTAAPADYQVKFCFDNPQTVSPFKYLTQRNGQENADPALDSCAKAIVHVHQRQIYLTLDPVYQEKLVWADYSVLATATSEDGIADKIAGANITVNSEFYPGNPRAGVTDANGNWTYNDYVPLTAVFNGGKNRDGIYYQSFTATKTNYLPSSVTEAQVKVVSNALSCTVSPTEDEKPASAHYSFDVTVKGKIPILTSQGQFTAPNTLLGGIKVEADDGAQGAVATGTTNGSGVWRYGNNLPSNATDGMKYPITYTAIYDPDHNPATENSSIGTCQSSIKVKNVPRRSSCLEYDTQKYAYPGTGNYKYDRGAYVPYLFRTQCVRCAQPNSTEPEQPTYGSLTDILPQRSDKSLAVEYLINYKLIDPVPENPTEPRYKALMGSDAGHESIYVTAPLDKDASNIDATVNSNGLIWRQFKLCGTKYQISSGRPVSASQPMVEDDIVAGSRYDPCVWYEEEPDGTGTIGKVHFEGVNFPPCEVDSTNNYRAINALYVKAYFKVR